MGAIFTLLIIYVVILIRLEPSFKTQKSPKGDTHSDKLKPNPLDEFVETPVQSTIRAETKELHEETRTTVGAPETIAATEMVDTPEIIKASAKSETDVPTPKEPILPQRKQASKKKELIDYKAKKAPKEPGPPGCSYYFGYLGELPKNTPIPDACLGCLKIMECLIKRSRAPQREG